MFLKTLTNILCQKEFLQLSFQIVSCPFLSIKFTVKDGINSETFHIDNQSKAVCVPCNIWNETNYLKIKTIVTCYCSQNYNENNFIRNYEEFLKFREL